jgi:hypothetical protein
VYRATSTPAYKLLSPSLFNPTNPTPGGRNRIDKGNSGFSLVSGLHLAPDTCSANLTSTHTKCRVAPLTRYRRIGLVIRKTEANVGFVGFLKERERPRLKGGRSPLCLSRAITSREVVAINTNPYSEMPSLYESEEPLISLTERIV